MGEFTYDQIAGCLIGGALGDALARDAEFMHMEQIIERYGNDGPIALPAPALVTDDTQMTLAVAEALASTRTQTPRAYRLALVREFSHWQVREPRRAPGRTCVQAVLAVRKGAPWQRASFADAKGCGANMRVAPVAFLPGHLVGGVAQLQSALTHGHPTALAAAELTALAVRWAAQYPSLADLDDRLLRYALRAKGAYEREWLGDYGERCWDLTVAEEMRFGWTQCIFALTKLAHVVRDDVLAASWEPCALLGGGWIAEELLAVAVYCAMRIEREDPREALYRATRTSGDSDSIAALTGQIVGANRGLDAWPTDWVQRIEYDERLRAASRALATRKY